jgi:hypothetical protein
MNCNRRGLVARPRLCRPVNARISQKELPVKVVTHAAHEPRREFKPLASS